MNEANEYAPKINGHRTHLCQSVHYLLAYHIHENIESTQNNNKT
jgi:hypothetical protein